jgi:hypothetical protein
MTRLANPLAGSICGATRCPAAYSAAGAGWLLPPLARRTARRNERRDRAGLEERADAGVNMQWSLVLYTRF